MSLQKKHQKPVPQFVLETRRQQIWGSTHAMEFLLLGAGGGVFLINLLLGSEIDLVLSFALVVSGAVVLILDIGHKLRLRHVFSHFRTSWVSRGAISVLVFLCATSLLLLARYFSASFGYYPQVELVLKAAGACASLTVMVYPAFVLAASRSIPLWHQPVLTPLMFAQSAISGLAAVSIVGAVTGQGSAYSWAMDSGTLVLIAAILSMVGILLYVLSRSNAAGRESAHLLSRGGYSRFFVAGIVLGLIIPSCLTAYALVFNGYLASAATVAAGALVLAGSFLFRFSILKSGVRDPLIEDAELTRRFERRQNWDAADISAGVVRQ